MEPIVFNVKDKSANTFFAEHSINGHKLFGQGPSEPSPYYFMQNEIIIKKTARISEGQQVVFELVDESRYSKKALINTYTYTVEAYDDVSIVLKLKDFKVTVDEPVKP